jgi:signal transduction histidine kinase
LELGKPLFIVRRVLREQLGKQMAQLGHRSLVTMKQQGSGLGLFIARMIINTYGGRIWAENRIGGGAVFHFTLARALALSA